MNGSVLHKHVCMFGKKEGEVVVESYLCAFLRDFASMTSRETGR